VRAFLDKWKAAYQFLKKEFASWSLTLKVFTTGKKERKKERKTDRQTEKLD